MISVTVMAHPKRGVWAEDLAARLGCGITWDEGWNDRHETGLRAIRAYDPEATHHLIVQDDAIPCRDLIAACEQLAVKVGEHPVGLYVGQTGPLNLTLDTLMRRGEPGFVASQGPHWGVAIMLPVPHLDDLAAWYESSTVENYDKRISRWYLRQGIDCWYTAPSLVNHRHQDNPSLVGGRNGGRQAAWFIGEDRSALEVDISTLLKGPIMATFRNVSTGQVVELGPDDSRFNRVNRMKHRWVRVDNPEPVPVTEPEGDSETLADPVGNVDDAALAEGLPEPDEAGVAAHVDMDASIPKILEAVAGDPEVAAAVLEAELSDERDGRPRTTLVEALGEILANAEPAEVDIDGPPANSGVDAG